LCTGLVVLADPVRHLLYGVPADLETHLFELPGA